MQTVPLFVSPDAVTTVPNTPYEELQKQTISAKPSDSHTRLTRWELLREAQKLLPDERVAFCMRRTKANTVDILYNPTHQSAHYGGLMVLWFCLGLPNLCCENF